ncbi:MAG: hypothetical protein D6711_03855 [Chloroflexi bacterium]|nr:MAG: hypothetical protein D6711_03855 [Chloroflexota bacterium]
MMKYRYCRSRMVAYINGELPPRVRRRMAQYIDTCPRCYAEYVRQRELQHELKMRVPGIGIPEAGQIERIWNAVQLQMQQPTVATPHLRYGVLIAVMVVLLMIPLFVSQPAVEASVATQPQPQTLIQKVVTPGATPVAVVVNNTLELTSQLMNVTPAAVVTPGG